ncbi:amidase-like [Corticium candelabrum]|uniref:amidase-like n=1 Tax=Corticium candelabrum TaxID=121492 RepID=UPI002E26E2DF|nr:amidase-like [Corticium candelabrum]
MALRRMRLSLLRRSQHFLFTSLRCQSSNTVEQYNAAAVRTPSLSLLSSIADRFNLDLSKEELITYQGFMKNILNSWTRLEEMSEPQLPVEYSRSPGYRPAPENNPFNAWYYKVDIAGAPTGRLHGKTLAIKDNVAVAGVPMMNGSRTLQYYTPEFDATVVTRILRAGGHVAGKSVCEDLCLSSSSFTSATGPVQNPHDTTRSAGGSSSGSAALVAGNVVDMALGGDQGGSIRMPSALCGIVGLKPTHGLVPYTGIFSIEMTLDHVGPMARTVADCAQLLEVIAGCDGLDPRQPTSYQVPSYASNLTSDLKGTRVGILKEGFGHPSSEADVDSLVMSAARMLEKAGASVEEISIPMHLDGMAIFDVISTEGAHETMYKSYGFGVGWEGHYCTSMLESFARGMKESAAELSHSNKIFLITGEAMKIMYHGRFYAKAQNIARNLRKAYDTALDTYDVLVMPTVPKKAPILPDKNCSIEEYLTANFEMIPNTAQFDVSGHPALTINAGFSEGLPVGMMIVGKRFDDQATLNVGFAFETLRDKA